MIAQQTIDEVNNLELFEVISKYVDLKKAGATWEGLSPFVDEKTPSFKVSQSKGVWKCFSSDISGNSGVSFVMKYLNNDYYPDAIKEIAGKFNIEIQYDDSDDAKKYHEEALLKKTLYDINIMALELFEKNASNEDLKDLRVSNSMREKFGIGYANKEFKNLLNYLISKGISERQIIEVGLATKSSKGVYDFFNSRTIFPIYNERKLLIGFGGRVWDNSKPKYINTKATKIFNKSNSLYGIHLAINEIRLKNHANIVEGYYDVIALHENGIENSIAPNGTSFTLDQAKFLRKYCDTIRLIMDGDKAGKKSMTKAIDMLLPLGFKVEVCILPETSFCSLDTKKQSPHDPDSILKDEAYQDDIKSAGLDSILDLFTKDAIEWRTQEELESADTTIKKAKAQSNAENLIALIPDSRLRNAYIKSLSKICKVNKSEIEKNVSIEIKQKKIVNDDIAPKLKLPPGGKEEEYDKYNFVEVYDKKDDSNIGYWFPKFQSTKIIFEKVSNFVIQPIMHIYSKTDNKRLIKIKNKRGERIIDVPSKGFVGFTQFQEAVIDEGNFFFSGTKIHFQKVMMKILEMFPTCEEIKTLGWQPEGFYCFSDGIAETSFKKIDTNGIIQFDGSNYFLPAFSDVYKNVREEDDLYENDRAFVYKSSNVSFEEWSSLFVRVHGNNGKIALAFFISTIFRDYIYKIHKVFPHLFLFGGISTGKSYCARSINSIFHGGQPGFNLTSGTNVGFFRKLARFRNAVAWFDEYENDIDSSRFQGLKAAYDGLGHEKGVMSRDNRTESTKVNSSSVISGQYIPTRDDNSLLSRSILCTFPRKAEDLTSDDKQKGSELKDMEEEGLSHLIVEVVKYRSEIEAKFKRVSFEIHENIKNVLGDESFSGRLLLNFELILTPIKILSNHLKLPFEYEDIETLAINMLIKQSDQITNSDALATFWNILEHLKATFKIRYGIDYKIETVNHLTIRVDRQKTEKITFKKPSKLLFLRFKNVHSLYLEAHRKQHGENGLASTSIISYFKSHKTFIGTCPATGFEDTKTSAYVFDYNMMDVELESNSVENEPKEKTEIKEEPSRPVHKEDDLPF